MMSLGDLLGGIASIFGGPLGGIAGTVLGGVLNGGGSKGSDVAQVGTFTPEQQQMMKLLAEQLTQRIGASGELSQQGMASYADLLGTALPEYNTNAGFDSALTAALSGAPMMTGDYFNKVVAAPAMREFNEVTLPGLREDYVGSGNFWSQARANAEGKAATDLATNLAGQQAQLEYAARESAANRQMGALSTALQAAGQEYNSGLAGRNELATELLNAAGLGSNDLQAALGMINTSGTATYQRPFEPSAWSQLMGIGGNIAAGAAQGGAFNDFFSNMFNGSKNKKPNTNNALFYQQNRGLFPGGV
jgi:hypothetical protein